MQSYEHITLSIDAGIANLTLARPAALNALSRPLLLEMIAALDYLRDTKTARVLVLRGEGKGFSSGADLASGSSPAGAAGFDAGDVLEHYYNPLMERLFALPIPIVAGVQGPVAGAGCMLALFADIVIAARSAFFLQAFVNIGLVPDAGSMWLLPRLIGRSRALGMMMLGERISAEKALEWGMIYDVVDTEALDAAVDDIAVRFAKGPTRSYALIRQGVRVALEQSFTQALQMEREAQRLAGNSSDFREGVSAFREKRPAQFTGE